MSLSPTTLGVNTAAQSHAEYNPVSFALAKQNWLNNQLRERQGEFTSREDILVFSGTWNVNEKKPSDDLKDWLHCQIPQQGAPKFPDIYVIGLQELDMTAQTLFLGDSALSAIWENAMLNTINAQFPSSAATSHSTVRDSLRADGYYQLLSRQLVGMLVVVYVRRSHRPLVKYEMADDAGVGIMGMMGNKGGVAIRFQFRDSTFCVVNSHLSAHMDNVQRRNQDYRDISRRIQFQCHTPDMFAQQLQKSLSSSSPNEVAHRQSVSSVTVASDVASSSSSKLSSQSSSSVAQSVDQTKTLTIFDHDHLIWLGDLNYRIEMNEAQVKHKIQNRLLSELLEHDQLIREMRKGTVFNGFSEGELAFNPTYKYDNNANVYDSSDKRRVPSWCDRILWCSGKSTQCKQMSLLSYSRHELLSSDHRPVSALFSAQVQSIQPEKQYHVFQTLVKQLDRVENECKPNVSLSSNQIAFSKIYYGVSTTRNVVITNSGQVVVRFRFVPKLNDHAICQPWLWIQPTFAMIVPGESITITLTVLVDASSGASKLNMGKSKLEDTLILHLENGKDAFISVSGHYQLSSFASPISHLIRFPGPVRTSKPLPKPTQLDDSADAASSSTGGTKRTADSHFLSVPKELWQIIDSIFRYGMKEESLFLETGVQQEMDEIREMLDTGVSLDQFKGSQYSMGETLVRFLEALPEPVITYSLYKQCIESSHSYAASKQLISFLPVPHYNVFHYIVSFLRQVLRHANHNQLTVSKLSMIFGAVMLRDRQPSSPSASKKQAQFLAHFLSGGRQSDQDIIDVK